MSTGERGRECAVFPARPPGHPGGETGPQGFALAVVVFLLFAIGVAAATGYRLVQTEARLATYSGDGAKTLGVALSGVERLLGEVSPDLSAAITYEIDGGEASITARRVGTPVFPHEVHLITSRATFSDPRYAETPARRTVRQYVTHWKAPLNILAAAAGTGTIDVVDPAAFELSGADVGVCPGAPRDVPPKEEMVELEALGVPWELLTDPALPVDSDALPPNSSSEYHLTRVMGDASLTSGSTQGRGILVVTGSLTIDAAFRWDGIILVGDDIMIRLPQGQPQGVYGAIVAGLNDSASAVTLERGRLRYDSCEVLAAGARLSRLTPLTNSWWEVH